MHTVPAACELRPTLLCVPLQVSASASTCLSSLLAPPRQPGWSPHSSPNTPQTFPSPRLSSHLECPPHSCLLLCARHYAECLRLLTPEIGGRANGEIGASLLAANNLHCHLPNNPSTEWSSCAYGFKTNALRPQPFPESL